MFYQTPSHHPFHAVVLICTISSHSLSVFNLVNQDNKVGHNQMHVVHSDNQKENFPKQWMSFILLFRTLWEFVIAWGGILFSQNLMLMMIGVYSGHKYYLFRSLCILSSLIEWKFPFSLRLWVASVWNRLLGEACNPGNPLKDLAKPIEGRPFPY